MDIMSSSFVPNGLLTSDAPKVSDEPAFVPNGLLGMSNASTPAVARPSLTESVVELPLESAELLRSSRIADNDEDLPFRPNGLLSLAHSLDPMGKLTSNVHPWEESSQFEDLPDVSEMLGSFLNKRPRGVAAPCSKTSQNSLPTHLHRRPVRATTFEGKSFYMKRKTRMTGAWSKPTHSEQRVKGLLDVPIHRLMDELSTTTAEKLCRPESFDCAERSKKVEDQLWVDRYRPQCFMDLMGNERVCRETMAWVKEWDWCVFGKKRGKKRHREDDENLNVEDEYHRPHERVLLLSGPPGLGKTTLAHVIAQHAGYEVMEINASDARTGQIVDDRIRPALESGSAVGRRKPVLLVIDEIDGATGDSANGFIHKLIQLITEKPRKKRQSRDPKSKRPILRPIICICNDQNALSLAKLRPIAYQIRFTRPGDIHTVKRLRDICEREGLRADTRALTTLVGVARGDLRGCLNTLQFIKSRNEEVTEPVIRSATAGMKEAETSMTSVLNNLFAPITKKRAKEMGMGEEEESKYVGRLSREVEGSGRENYIALGCFAHYTNLRQHDANFSRYEKANEWLITFDSLSSIMYTEGEFALAQYLPYFLVPFYPLFQERGGPKVERDQADWDNIQTTRTNEEIYKTISHSVNAAGGRLNGDFRHLVSSPTLELEFAPYLNRIISPPLRPVNRQVIRPEERALLTRLVDIMVKLELRFMQEKADDGQLVYRLDPPVDVFVTYDGKRATDIAVSRYAVRHLVAAEIDAQLIVQNADFAEKQKSGGKHEYFSRSNRRKEQHGADRTAEDEQSPNKRPKLEKTDIADKPPVDFFGRLIDLTGAAPTKMSIRKNVEKKYRVTYRYAEGNSAAVRKPVKVGAFA